MRNLVGQAFDRAISKAFEKEEEAFNPENLARAVEIRNTTTGRNIRTVPLFSEGPYSKLIGYYAPETDIVYTAKMTQSLPKVPRPGWSARSLAHLMGTSDMDNRRHAERVAAIRPEHRQ